MFALLRFFLALFSSLFKSKSRLEAENAALRRQLIVLQRKVRGRVHFTNSDGSPDALNAGFCDPRGHSDEKEQHAPRGLGAVIWPCCAKCSRITVSREPAKLVAEL